MPYKRIISGIITLFICLGSIHGQKTAVSGFITDSLTGEYLIGATVYNPTKGLGSASNSYGFYSVSIETDKNISLRFSYVGYKDSYITIAPNKDTIIDVTLIPGSELNEVTVNGSNIKKLEDRPETGKVLVPLDQIKTIPSMTGEADILKAYQLMPGIQGGMEGHNGIYVRGGTPDQNLFLLDDVPLYNVSHLGGLYSVFDPSMVKKIDFYKGGFPARYGGRTSAVVDIRNKDGNRYNKTGELELSLLLSKFYIEGPLKKGKSSFAFSVRRSNIDLFAYLYGFMQNEGYYVGYTFYDINAKSNFYLTDKDRLIVNFYQGRDKFFYNDKPSEDDLGMYRYKAGMKQKWGNTLLSTRWQHVVNQNIFHNLTAAYTTYIYNQSIKSSRTELADNSVLENSLRIHSGIQDLILKSDFEIALGSDNLRLGSKVNYQFYVPTRLTYTETGGLDNQEDQNPALQDDPALNAGQIALYGEYIFEKGNLSGNIGMHLSDYFVEKKAYPSIEPRIVLNYLLKPSLSIKASACAMQQNIHLLTNSYTGLPTDLWIPSTQNIEPETSQQVSLGLAHTSKNNIEFSIEAYYKKLEHLISYKEGVQIFSTSQSWDEKIETNGHGWVKGIEFLVQKKEGRFTGWIGYTLSSNTRQFSNLNNGRVYPFKYDQRHDIALVANWKVNSNWSLSGTWVYHTGYAITLPSGKYQLYHYEYKYTRSQREVYDDIHIYAQKNGYRMPDYHRLDIGWIYTKKKFKGTSIWKWGIYNVYNRQNAYYLFFKEDKGETKLYQQSIFPLFLNVGYSYVF
ncbi:carboxypeptidase-like regulatory domain-containing protein [Saccharicrinis sp. FJH54]|uniref:TonB-dependent receptor n=1 Tax=Saccharicrinis sp. FJH54 TaxID=3344665 RepID=UPI0035D4A60D